MQELMNRGYDKFKDCGPTITFIRKINDLVDIMNSNIKKYGLQADINSHSNKVTIALFLFTFIIFFYWNFVKYNLFQLLNK